MAVWAIMGHRSSAHVSVPFTRGTPPWQLQRLALAVTPYSFSPLHEGDTSVARVPAGRRGGVDRVSVPFTRGTPPWRRGQAAPACQLRVSVPFTRGTPPWRWMGLTVVVVALCFSPLHEGDTSVASLRCGR